VIRELRISTEVGFSALQRAEIAEIFRTNSWSLCTCKFQCSSTSRNCWNLKFAARRFQCHQFQCSSTSRNCWNVIGVRASGVETIAFQCSSTSRNCWNMVICNVSTAALNVSVLFNEPKLLKFKLTTFVALYIFAFQCSSTSRNCWNKTDVFESYSVARSFSALQRAEIAEIFREDCLQKVQ